MTRNHTHSSHAKMDEMDTLDQLSPASVRAYKRIIQYVHKHELATGQLLPPQQELRVQLKLTNDALTRAMGLLCKQGVLERKTKSGTRVVDMSQAANIRWTVGLANIAAPQAGPLSTFSTLAHHFQVAAASRGWNVQTFYRFNETTDMPTLGDFGDLESHTPGKTSDRDRTLDGLVSFTPLDRTQWAKLVENDIPVMHGPFWETAPCGVVIDQQTLTSQAVQLLADPQDSATPCTRFGAVVGNAKATTTQLYAKGLAHGLAQAGLNPNDSQVLSHGHSIEGGQNVARDLLALPADKRPDALIVLDDYIALGMTQVLWRTLDANGHTYHPKLAVQTNREVLQNFHLPVVRFEVNLAGIANKLIDGMQQRLLNPSIPQSVEFVPAMACEESDSPFDTRHTDIRHLAVPAL